MRFGLVSLVGRGAPVEGFLKASLCLISGRLFTHARALVGAAKAAEDLSVREYERADRSARLLGKQNPDAALASA